MNFYFHKISKIFVFSIYIRNQITNFPEFHKPYRKEFSRSAFLGAFIFYTQLENVSNYGKC